MCRAREDFCVDGTWSSDRKPSSSGRFIRAAISILLKLFSLIMIMMVTRVPCVCVSHQNPGFTPPSTSEWSPWFHSSLLVSCTVFEAPTVCSSRGGGGGGVVHQCCSARHCREVVGRGRGWFDHQHGRRCTLQPPPLTNAQSLIPLFSVDLDIQIFACH